MMHTEKNSMQKKQKTVYNFFSKNKIIYFTKKMCTKKLLEKIQIATI